MAAAADGGRGGQVIQVCRLSTCLHICGFLYLLHRGRRGEERPCLGQTEESSRGVSPGAIEWVGGLFTHMQGKV